MCYYLTSLNSRGTNFCGREVQNISPGFIFLGAPKKNGFSQEICTSLSIFNKKFLSTFDFVSKINKFLLKSLPFHTPL